VGVLKKKKIKPPMVEQVIFLQLGICLFALDSQRQNCLFLILNEKEKSFMHLFYPLHEFPRSA
jgi:hypothetical protein